MKIVKLDNRHGAFKEGYSHALRFESWSSEVSKIEKKVSDLFGIAGWRRREANTWYAEFGSKGNYRNKPYWIFFRDEASITFLWLATSNINEI